MTVFIVETYVTKPEREEELKSLLQKIAKYKRANPEKFKEMKSKRIFTQMFGSPAGQYIEMIEFSSLADAERYMNRIFKDKTFTKLYQEALLCTVPATYSMHVWNAVE